MIEASKILIVDNPSTTLKILTYACRALGMEVFGCGFASEALEMFEQDRPDFVLVDVDLPDMHGFELARRLRKIEPPTEWSPILFLTSLNDSLDLNTGIEAGGDDYLYKPISELILAPKIIALQRMARTRKQLIVSAEKLGLSNSQLKELVHIDGLTGISNRRRFNEQIQKEWRRMQRYNADLCLLLCDIDFFKNFNDTFGHLAGDRCLNAVAETISKLLTRSGDVVSRYGGEEFTVLLPNTTRDGGMLIAERIRAAVSKIYPSADAPQFPQVTISIGVAATVPNKVDSPETLIAAADKALYRAKDQGRNTVCLADFNT